MASSDSTASAGWIAMGTARPHGVRGELRVQLHHAESSLKWPRLEIALRPRGSANLVVARVTTARRVPGAVLVTLDGMPTRTEVEPYAGAEVLVQRASLPPAAKDEVYVEDLVGLDVAWNDRVIGKVEGVAVYPASTCLVVGLLDEPASIEVPLAEPYVEQADLIDRVVRVAHVEDLERVPRRGSEAP